MKWTSVGDYVAAQTATGARIVSKIVQDPERLKQLYDPMSPTLIPHAPAILARLDKLESHVAPILERVLNNRRHLASIEPYLDGILERFDDIEPHLPWLLDNIDVLAPYTGLLLKHIDSLLLYTDVGECDGVGSQYALAEQLLPYLEFYVSRLDLIGPHLPLIRPHIPKLLKHQRIAALSPYVDKLWTSQGLDLSISANLDILVFYFGKKMARALGMFIETARSRVRLADWLPRAWLHSDAETGLRLHSDGAWHETCNPFANRVPPRAGWIFRVPLLRRVVAFFFSLPGAVKIVTMLANRLPKRFVRGR